MVRPGKLSIIGNGVVVDPWALLAEIDDDARQGRRRSRPQNLKLADNAALILPSHGALDRAREERRGDRKIGTTGRGIGPAYEDKVGRRAVRVCDLADPQALEDRVDDLLLHHNALLRGLDAPEIDRGELIARLREVAPKVLPYAAPVWRLLDEARRAGRRILFEGAQGAMLDVDHGTYPYVTSSNTVAGQAAAGSGIAPSAIGFVLGITKAYTTRVGSGPFPTELTDAIGQTLGERGREFGTVTGRPRRCGWFDAVAVRQAVKIAGIDGIALTKLDVLDGFDEIKICTAYRRGGKATTTCRPAPRRRPRSSRSTRAPRAGRKAPAAPLLGGTAGDRDQVHPPPRGADRRAGGDAVDQPGTRRHGAGARPVRRLARRRPSGAISLNAGKFFPRRRRNRRKTPGFRGTGRVRRRANRRRSGPNSERAGNIAHPALR